jgi:hypothetical protein
MGIPTLKSWHFEATEYITKFKSHGFHSIKILYFPSKVLLKLYLAKIKVNVSPIHLTNEFLLILLSR